METSILKSIKKLLGISEDSGPFDMDIIIHINSVMSILQQLGVGPAAGFRITGDGETWEDFAGSDPRLEMVKSYVYLKVKLLFDPPLGSAVMEAMSKQIAELEWRLNVQVDPGDEE